MHYRLFLLLSLLLCVAAPAAAQSPADLKSLRVSLWPEYDDPRLLVIIDGETAAAGQTVRIPLPAQATLNAVAVADADGSFLNAESTTETTGGVQVVSFAPEQPAFRVEYYVPLVAQGGQRIAEFSLPAGFVMAPAVAVEALLPPNATGLDSDPTLESAGAENLQLFQGTLGALTGENGLSQKLTYQNPTGALTVPEGARVTPAPAATTPAPVPAASSGSDSRTLLIVGLGILAVVLVAGGLYGLWRTRQTPEDVAPLPGTGRTIRPKAKAPAAPAAGGADQDRFCRKCGAEFRREDRFCRKCGAQRR